jgi:hypothetical protein
MLNGCLLIRNFAPGVIKQSKEVLDAILWLAYVEKVSVFCVQGHGNPTIKIISNAISTKKVKINLRIDKRIFLRK